MLYPYNHETETERDLLQTWDDFLNKLAKKNIMPIRDQYGAGYYAGFPNSRLDLPDNRLLIYKAKDRPTGISITNCHAPIVLPYSIGNIDINFEENKRPISYYENPALINVKPYQDNDKTYNGFNQRMTNLQLVSPSDISFFSGIISDIQQNLTNPNIGWVSSMDIKTGNRQTATTQEGTIVKMPRGEIYWLPKNQTNIPNIFYNPINPNSSFSIWIDVGYKFNQNNPTVLEIFPANARPGIIYDKERDNNVTNPNYNQQEH